MPFVPPNQLHRTINKHIDVSVFHFSFSNAPVHLIAVCKHARGYPLGPCNTSSSFKHAALQGIRAETAGDSALFACFVCKTA